MHIHMGTLGMTRSKLSCIILLAAIALFALAYAQLSRPREIVAGEERSMGSCTLFENTSGVWTGVCGGAERVFWAEAVAIVCVTAAGLVVASSKTKA